MPGVQLSGSTWHNGAREQHTSQWQLPATSQYHELAVRKTVSPHDIDTCTLLQLVGADFSGGKYDRAVFPSVTKVQPLCPDVPQTHNLRTRQFYPVIAPGLYEL